MVDYKELAKRIAASAREAPNSEDNARRVWEIWTQTAMFDPRDRLYNFCLYSGLPTGLVMAYIRVCQDYQMELSYTVKPPKSQTQKT